MMDSGRSTRTMADGGMVTGNADGSTTYSSGSAQSNVGMSAMVGQTVREEVSDRASEATRSVQTQSEDFTNSVSNSASQLSDFGMSFTNGQTSGWENSTSFSEEDRSNIGEAWSEVERFSETHGLSTDVGLKAMLAGQAGLGVNAIAKFAANLDAQGSLSGSSVENFQNAVQQSHDQNYSKTLSSLTAYAERAQYGRNGSEGETGSNSVRSNYDEVQQSAERLSASFEQAQSLEHANSYLQSQDMSYNGRLTDAVITELGQQGFNDDEISALVNPKTTAGVKRQQEVVGQILPDILNELGLGQQNFSAPMAPNLSETPPIEHTSVDPANNPVVRPEGGDFTLLRDNAFERIDYNRGPDDKFDTVTIGSEDGTGRVEEKIADGQTQAESSPLDALIGRGENVAFDVADRVSGMMGNSPSQEGQGQQGGGDGTSLFGAAMGAAFRGTPAGLASSMIGTALDAGKAFNEPPKGDGDTALLAEIPVQQTPQQAVDRANAGLQDSGMAENHALSIYERDVVTRTILGEAANQGDLGQAAVAAVIQNRVSDPRWGDDPAEVALQMKQFSAWNSGAGGNHLVDEYQPGDPAYDRAAIIADQVFDGNIQDPTGGATHYYSPTGMDALVNNGDQSNMLPRWLQQENARRGGEVVTIGGHIFTGKAQD